MPNRLAGETSPYLQQHADNPVEWYPWGEAALARARDEDKPILLSVGYSACHWCHVMAHESFEDPAIAAIMNRHFVNVKVDREERPDLDQIYQSAHQMFNRRPGGWPLTAFLAPDQTPFFVGTYFPKASRYNLPGFGELLEHIATLWRDRREDVTEQNASVRAAFAGLETTGRAAGAPSEAVLKRAAAAMQANFDRHYGGFGAAPKFPHPTDIEFLMRRYAATGDAGALHVATFTLQKMAEGGLYDQLGGGFCRYSVDERWEIPHFEKMLYDNGQLLALYADAWAVTGNPLFARVVEETVAWTRREMQPGTVADAGGYCSSLDADSEHEEGKFYVWTPAEVAARLTQDEYAVAAGHWGLDGPANFEERHWHLHVARPLAEVARRLRRDEQECEALLDAARRKLFDARAPRVRPGRDDKVLTSWNALMIRGMARAARVFDRADWLASAHRALAFIRETLYRDGRLLATGKDGRAHLNAYLDDYAYLLDAVIELAQCEFRREDLALARELAETLLAQFEDRDGGGFFFTSHDHEALLQRPKTPYDNATPAGNGVAAFALQRLGHLLGEPRYLDAATRTIEAFYDRINDHPAAFGSFMKAIEERLEPTEVIVLRGAAAELAPWRRALGAEYRPHSLVLAVADTETALPEPLAKPSVAGAVNAYVCRGVSCLPAVSTPAELRGVSKPARIH